MITIDYNNAKLVDVLGCNGDVYFCWVNTETGAVLREFDETDLEITSEYVEVWDAGREAIVGAWIDETGGILETTDETTREAGRELAFDDGLCLELDDDFAFVF